MEETISHEGRNLSVTEPGTDFAEPLAESAGVEAMAANHGNGWTR